MSAMTTTLATFSRTGNVVTFTAPGHTVAKPRLLIQKRNVPASPTAVAQSTSKVVYGTVDNVTSIPLAAKVAIDITSRMPVNATSADVDGAIALARDFVASDAFVAAVKSQLFVS